MGPSSSAAMGGTLISKLNSRSLLQSSSIEQNWSEEMKSKVVP